MATTVKIEDLRRAAVTAARVADRKSTMPILSHTLIKLDGARVTVQATDLVTSATTEIAGSGSDHGSVAVPAKALADAIKGLPKTGELELAIDDNRALVVRHGASTSRLLGMPSQDYPKIPEITGSTGAESWRSVDGEALAGAIGTVSHAVCKDETRFHLCGVLLESSASAREIACVATDGHRLVKSRVACVTSGDGISLPRDVIVPSKGASEVAKLLGSSDEPCQLALSADKRYLHVRRVNGDRVSVKLVDSRFPPYEQVIPKGNTRVVTCDRKALIASLKRLAKVSTETRGVKLAFSWGKLALVADHPEVGESRETIDDSSAPTDDDFACGVNPKYLVECASALDGDRIVLSFGGSVYRAPSGKGEYRANDPALDPILVATDEGTPATFGIVMPMRI